MPQKPQETLDEKLFKLTQEDTRYKIGAYRYIYEILEHTNRVIGEKRHVTGQDLLLIIREDVKLYFGPFAKLVLNHWGIYTTEDWGEVVFNLVERDMLGSTEEDSIDDFRNGYNFDEEFSVDKTVDLKDVFKETKYKEG